MSKCQNSIKTKNTIEKILAYKTRARSINLTELVFISSHVQIAGRNTLDKLEDHSERGIMNIISIPNILIQIRHLQNTYKILHIHLALWNV